MTDSKVVLVKMAEIAVAEGNHLLKTTLGSCVGVVLYDAGRALGGLAHVMLPQRLRGDEALGKYADTAVPELLSRLLSRGSRKGSLKAFLAGGANMFRFVTDSQIATIGEKNIAAVRSALNSLEIPISFEDTGGDAGRTVVFTLADGRMSVHKLARIEAKGGTAR